MAAAVRNGGGNWRRRQGGRAEAARRQWRRSARPTAIIYTEPPFELFRKLDGVEAAARVLQTKGNIVVSGRSIGQGTVMGIDNVEFAKVAWFRNDLLPMHPFNYLNYLGLIRASGHYSV